MIRKQDSGIQICPLQGAPVFFTWREIDEFRNEGWCIFSVKDVPTVQRIDDPFSYFNGVIPNGFKKLEDDVHAFELASKRGFEVNNHGQIVNVTLSSASEPPKVDPVIEAVCKRFRQRSEVGLKKYGTFLADNKKDNFLNHALDEAMDFVDYLQTLIMQKRDITDLVKSEPNDTELGKKIRKIYS